ncbi:MAG TPA: hypothetical protein VN238_02850 [Solirubrobacteraceae bacterium]|nr:hypothetical protein [Solirubrobacteraceae bacterium]
MYDDDAQITTTLSMKIPVSATLPVDHLGRQGETAFRDGVDFVHIKVSLASDTHIGIQ